MRNFVVAIFILLLSFSSVNAEENMHKSAVAGISDLIINEKDRDQTEKNALLGDADSAFRIFQFENLRGNIIESRYWLEIAAINGNPNAAYNLGSLLIKTNEDRSHTRAIFWFEKAKKGGVVLAEKRLRELTMTDK